MNYLLDIKSAFLPEIIILFFILINILLALFINKKNYKLATGINILGVLSALCSTIFLQAEPTYSAFNNSIICNVYTTFFKCLILIAAFFIVLLSKPFIKKHNTKVFEYFAILMTSIFYSLILTSANDFLMIFIVLSMLIINNSLFILNLNNLKSKICAYKYLSRGLCTMTLFAFGVSYLYGIIGSLNFDSMSVSLIGYEGGLLFSFAIIFIILSLILNLNGIYWGILNILLKNKKAPTSLLLSLISQFALYAILSRILILTYNNIPTISLIIIILSLIMIFYSLFKMLNATKLNNFLEYSIISQNGFMLLILSITNIYNIASLLYCLICYLFTIIALYTCFLLLYQNFQNNKITVLNGIAYKYPFFTTAMIFIFMSLAGLAPTCGFWERFFILSSVSRLGINYFPALLITLFLFVLAIIVYAKPILLMFDKTIKNKAISNMSMSTKIIIYFCTAIIILLCFYSGKIVELCDIIAYILH